MRISDLAINAEATVGDGLLLTDVVPVYAYADGKRTDTVTAYKYVVAMSERSYDKIAVKIMGTKQLETPIDDTPVVEFEDLEIFAYYMRGTYNIGARAKAIRFV